MEFYHLLNRGVDKRNIFLDEKDYVRFIHNLFVLNNEYVSDSNNYHFEKYLRTGENIRKKQARKVLVNIHFFCLMPNHYHLLVSPAVEGGVPLFMKKINMGYAKYFNEKNERVGALFQGKYKSVSVTNEVHFLYLPYYIHLNPLDLKMPEWRMGKIRSYKKAEEYLQLYRWSSHLDYLGIRNFPSITHRKFFLDFFNGERGYTKSISAYLKEFNPSGFEDILLE